MHFIVVITAQINLVTMSGETDFRDLVRKKARIIGEQMR